MKPSIEQLSIERIEQLSIEQLSIERIEQLSIEQRILPNQQSRQTSGFFFTADNFTQKQRGGDCG